MSGEQPIKAETHSVFACPFCGFAAEITQPGRAAVEAAHRLSAGHLRRERQPRNAGGALAMRRREGAE